MLLRRVVDGFQRVARLHDQVCIRQSHRPALDRCVARRVGATTSQEGDCLGAKQSPAVPRRRRVAREVELAKLDRTGGVAVARRCLRIER